ncbi:nitroreductase [Gluconacetobacter johannae DSM 13595]|uniref:Nitroreductase family protein n=1 Tax=Gluconacetobacter johannae TaxID=112140 RepID=A0A7W4J7M0_9PROT|nr:nitroreductase family protein [Gluconacetobacter johannae]MBB2176193.1 nitroreductase family protein [Gluconacetobacter johannae]GBQ89216.1 nitroreductase [Gluconacetobacter johannae DSM 13595]
MTTAPSRTSAHPVERLFLDRWSPRAYDGAPIAEDVLLSFLEAGRWAASAYNSQPWRFVYARRDTPDWDRFVGYLIPFNQSWAGSASALVFVLSGTTMLPPGKTAPVPAPTHAFDAGAAAAQIMLQATSAGWAAHAMSGIDHDAIRAGLGVPDDHAIHAAIAIGRQAAPEILPEGLRGREAPSDRLPLSDIAFPGRFAGG